MHSWVEGNKGVNIVTLKANADRIYRHLVTEVSLGY